MIPSTFAAVSGAVAMPGVVFVVSTVVIVLSSFSSVDSSRGHRSPAVDSRVFRGRLGVELWPIGGSRRRHVRSPFPCEISSSDESPYDVRYAVIIDAGSSGSRVHVYQWSFSADDARLPRLALDASGRIEHSYSTKLEPGLSSHAGDLQRVAADVLKLLNNASVVVPQEKRSSTPVYIMATAGMRTLLEDRMNRVFQFIDTKMKDREFNPFQYNSVHNTRILSGEEEGVFAWIAVNYLTGALASNGSAGDTVGVLEMGGQSTQIAFIPPGNVLASKFPVHIGGYRYPLYVHSYLNYGQNAVDARIKRILVDRAGDVTPTTVIDNPCMMIDHKAFDVNTNCSFIGIGNATACRMLLDTLVPKAMSHQCHQKPCAIGPAYQPTIVPSKQFYAIGSFIHAAKAIKAISPDNAFIPEVVLEKAAEYCSRNYTVVIHEAMQAGEKVGLKYIGTTCLRAFYYAILVTRGYEFGASTKQIKVVDKVNNLPLDWTLGAILYENELEFVHSCRRHIRDPSPPMAGQVQFAIPNSSPTTATHRSLSLAPAVAVATAIVFTTSSLLFPITR